MWAQAPHRGRCPRSPAGRDGPFCGDPGPDGAKQVLTALVARFPGLPLIWADGGYAGKLVAWVMTVLQRTLVIVKRPRHTQGFQVVQWRWIVERTFGWLNRSRRLSKDFEALPETKSQRDFQTGLSVEPKRASASCWMYRQA